MSSETDTLRIADLRPLPSPADLARDIPIDDAVRDLVTGSRAAIR